MAPPAGRFHYLMLRVLRTADEPEQITGLAELLQTGEKRGFESGEQLLRLIGDWAGGESAAGAETGPTE